MIKELDELSKKFAKPSEVSASQLDINTVTGDFKKGTSKFIQDVHATMQRKKHTNVVFVAVSY